MIASPSSEKPPVPPNRWRKPLVIVGGLMLGLAGLSGLGYFVVYPAVQSWRMLQAAEEALREDNLRQAAERLREAVAHRPGDARLRFLLARTLRRLGELSAARRELAEAARLGHPREEIDLENVLLLAQTGDMETVADTLEALIAARHPDAPLLYEGLTRGYLALHDLRNAERWATLWIQAYPTDWRAWLRRGMVREQGVQLDPALQDYVKAAELRPGDAEIQFRVGEMLRRLDRFAEALPHLEAAAQAFPDQPDKVLAVAKCLRSLGRVEDALVLLKRWHELHPEAPADVYALLGRLAADLHRDEEALNWLRQAERLSPSQEETLNTLTVLYRELGQESEAEKYEARAKDVHRKLKRIDGLLRALKNEPRSVPIRHEIGRLLLTLGMDEQALPWLLSALEGDPDHRPTHAALAEYYEALGDREMARNHRLAAEGKAKARVER